MREALKKRKVSDVEASEKISIKSKSLKEPNFSLGRGEGTRDFVLPGNKDFSVGDVIPKPDGRRWRRRSKGSADGSGDDDFVFTLTKEEFLDLFFEDLKLPNLVKAKLKSLRNPESAARRFPIGGPARPAQSRPHHAQQPRAPHRAQPSLDRFRSRGWRRSWRCRSPPTRATRPVSRICSGGWSASSTCATRLPTSIRSICATSASRMCRGRPPRR